MADSSDLTALLFGEDLPQVHFLASSNIASKGVARCVPPETRPLSSGKACSIQEPDEEAQRLAASLRNAAMGSQAASAPGLPIDLS